MFCVSFIATTKYFYVEDVGNIRDDPTQSETEADVVYHGINDILQDIRDDSILKHFHAEMAQGSSVAEEQIVTKQPSFVDKEK